MQESKSRGLLQICGLHPLVALGVTVVDGMLFAETAATMGVGWLVSLPVAAVLAIATAFIQKSSFGDSWVLGIGKGLIVGLLTAIPTPLPSIITLTSGATGAISLLKNKRNKNH